MHGGQRAANTGQCGSVDLVTVGRKLQVRVRVARFIGSLPGEMLGKINQQFRLRWCTHADRIGQARIHRDAVMRHAGRQVQHVAGIERPRVGRMEFAQELEFDVIAERGRRMRIRIDLPMPLALPLQQEHIVLVDVRADRTARRGEADHHVVDAPARQEIETFKQGPHVGIPLVDVLHEQGPVVIGQLRELGFREWAAAQAPPILLAIVLDDARQRGFLAGQASQVFRR